MHSAETPIPSAGRYQAAPRDVFRPEHGASRITAERCASIQTVAFARWDPIRDLLAIQQRLDRFAPGPTGWKPPVDLYETAAEYVITAELPGLSRGDIQIQFHDGRLTLSGVRQRRPNACEQFHRVERGHGSFSRTFQLPVPIDRDAIRADLHWGVLTVICPKHTDASTRRIHIN